VIQLQLVGKLIVDLSKVINEHFLLALKAEALSRHNRLLLKGVGYFVAKY